MINKSEMPFLDHLEELRWRLIKSIIGIVIGSMIVFLFIDQIFEIMLRPVKILENPPKLQVLKVHGMFMLEWFISLAGGFILALPVLTYHLWKFIAPGLLKNERRYAFPVIFFSFIAFLTGVLFAYYVIIPFSMEFFTSVGYVDVENNFSINYYFSYLIWIILAAGLVFELPVLVVILSSIGLVTPPFMRHYQRHAIVVILILSAFITPPDPISLLMMSIPLIILYEISIWLSKLFVKKV